MTKKTTPAPAYHLSHRAPLYFLFLSVLCQAIGAGLLTLLQNFLTSAFWLVATQCISAALVARWLRMSWPWQVFNLVLMPLVLTYGLLGLPSWIALALAAAAALMYLPTFWTRVPYYPTSRKMYDLILAEIPEGSALRFIDLGCGFGTLLAYLARRRPQVIFEGVEISPLPYLISRLRLRSLSGGQASVSLSNFWTFSLEPYDIVYAFLSPVPMPYLWEKVKMEMKPGSLFITNTFPVEAESARKIQVDDSHQGTLYLHRIAG